MDSIPEKKCLKCGLVKSVSEFHREKATKDGFTRWCADCRCARAKEYQAKNTKEINVRKRAAYHANPVSGRLRRVRLTPEQREGKRESGRRHYRENKTAYAESRRRRRVREMNCPGFHTDAEWRELLDRFGGRCASCGSTEHISRDHIVPLFYGGSDNIDNIQPLCKSCNSAKGTKTIDYRPAACLPSP